MEIGLQLTGLTALLTTLTVDLVEAVEPPVLRRVLLQAGEPMRATMSALAPRGTVPAHIADYILIKPLSASELEAVTDDHAGVEIGPDRRFFYGYFFEFGTIELPARPFARPAFDTTQREALAIIERELTTVIMRVAQQGTT